MTGTGAERASVGGPAQGIARERLLVAAVAYVQEHGIADLSLRELARELGTSHRMLVHHFGSKRALWVEIVRAVEEGQRGLLAQIIPDPASAGAQDARAWWKHISDPDLWQQERLFFELYGQALQGHEHAAGVLEGVVEDWVRPVSDLIAASGIELEAARAQARLGLAVTRGLLLDLLATGDVAGVDAAMEAFIEMQQRAVEELRGA
jgi:AcrR family transcriptional regulator